MIDINKFLQLNNPDIARQTRNMSYFDALKSEIPGTKSYQGYNPFYKGADKTGLSGYLKQGVNSVQGKFTPGSNVGGATPLTRKLAQDTMRLGIGASQAGKSVLGRVLGTALGPAAGYASALAAPTMYMASMLDGPNVRSGAADEYVGMMGEAMPEEDYAGLADLLGIPEASQALDDEYYDFDKEPNPYSELDDFDKEPNPGLRSEEEKGRGILDILKSGAMGAKDLFLEGAGATSGLNIGARLGMMINPALAIPSALAGAFLGSKVTEMGPSGSFYEGLTDEQKSEVDDIYGQDGIMQGYNPVSMFGKGAAGAIDTRMGNIMQTLQKQALEGKVSEVLEQRQRDLQAARDRITGTIRDSSGTITGGTGQGIINAGNTGGYGGTGSSSPSAVSSDGRLGGGV